VIVKVLDGLSRQPIRLAATAVVVYAADGVTPILVGISHGPGNSARVAHAADADFADVLRAAGESGNVRVETLETK
jgi:hypothetical protein